MDLEKTVDQRWKEADYNSYEVILCWSYLIEHDGMSYSKQIYVIVLDFVVESYLAAC